MKEVVAVISTFITLENSKRTAKSACLCRRSSSIITQGSQSDKSPRAVGPAHHIFRTSSNGGRCGRRSCSSVVTGKGRLFCTSANMTGRHRFCNKSDVAVRRRPPGNLPVRERCIREGDRIAQIHGC